MKNHDVRIWITSIFLLLFSFRSWAQFEKASRFTDWSSAGLESTVDPDEFETIFAEEYGITTDTLKSNSDSFENILTLFLNKKIKILFKPGKFYFSRTISLPSNIILKGSGADSTEFIFDLNGTGHSIEIKGAISKRDTSSVSKDIKRNNQGFDVNNTTIFQKSDWVYLQMNDSSLITSSWAKGSVAQIFKIKNIRNNTLYTNSLARLAFPLNNSPLITKLIPAENVGIECIKITRKDNTAPVQSSNIHLDYAVNCWVKGIESSHCTFSHLEARHSSNISIQNSFFHDGHEYGGGGRAYGVMLHLSTNECLVENNIFKHLRHSMIVQAGANGNVFTHNYSIDPFWETIPTNSAGDMVLHGNYVFCNLFEQNICQNIVIDNSHGPNGPNNTFYRNKADGYGIFFSSNNSPNQNFIGNEITNKSLPFSLVNYTIQGSNQLEYANNNKGNITPTGTENLIDTSLFYKTKMGLLKEEDWISIGPPNALNTAQNHASRRFTANQIYYQTCDTAVWIKSIKSTEYDGANIFPNPMHHHSIIYIPIPQATLKVYNYIGELVIYKKYIQKGEYRISSEAWKPGIYFFKIESELGIQTIKCIKIK